MKHVLIISCFLDSINFDEKINVFMLFISMINNIKDTMINNIKDTMINNIKDTMINNIEQSEQSEQLIIEKHHEIKINNFNILNNLRNNSFWRLMYLILMRGLRMPIRHYFRIVELYYDDSQKDNKILKLVDPLEINSVLNDLLNLIVNIDIRVFVDFETFNDQEILSMFNYIY